LLERRLYPKIRGTREHALRKVQDTFDVELLDLRTVPVNLDQRQFFAKPAML
jgi:hypothetical protein